MLTCVSCTVIGVIAGVYVSEMCHVELSNPNTRSGTLLSCVGVNPTE
jgi:hypothetical protein